MKKIYAVLLVVLLGVTMWTYATESVTQSYSQYGRPPNDTLVVTFTWTSAANGSVTATAIATATMTLIKGMYLSQVVTDPGSTAPTDNYAVTVTDANSLDLLGAAGANRDDTNTEVAFPTTVARPVDTTLTLNITSNVVDSATGVTKLYFSRTPTGGTQSASISGTVDVNVASGVTVDVAEGAAAGAYPALIGGIARSSDGTAVDTGDSVRAYMDLLGKLTISPYSISDNWFVSSGSDTGTNEITLQSASASLRYYITAFACSNTSAATAADALILDGASGSTLYRIPCPALGGATATFPTPIPLSTTNKAVIVKSSASVSTMYFSVTGFKAIR